MTRWAIEVDGRSLPVLVTRSRRRTIALHLQPGPRLELRAPRQCGDPELRAFPDARRGWVARHLPDLPPPPAQPRFRDGDAQPYLGRNLRLQLTPPGPRRIVLGTDCLTVTVPDPRREDRVPAALGHWYRRRAEAAFGECLRDWHSRRLAGWCLPPVRLRLRRMRRRWGSCSSDRVITLNTRLVERAPALIELVVVHELCHLIEFNHSRRFHALMDEAMPDWRDRSRALDRGGLRLEGD